MSIEREFIVRQGFAEEIDKSHVWLSSQVFRDLMLGNSGSRPRIWIMHGNVRIAAEALIIDWNTMRRLLRRSEGKTAGGEVVLTAWQRHQLGMSDDDPVWNSTIGFWGAKYKLKITPCSNHCSNVRAALHIARTHPQVVVRCTYQLAKWSIIFGFLGLLISALSAGISLQDPKPFGVLHWLLLVLAIPVYLLLALFLWMGLIIFPICVVLRWWRMD